VSRQIPPSEGVEGSRYRRNRDWVTEPVRSCWHASGKGLRAADREGRSRMRRPCAATAGHGGCSPLSAPPGQRRGRQGGGCASPSATRRQPQENRGCALGAGGVAQDATRENHNFVSIPALLMSYEANFNSGSRTCSLGGLRAQSPRELSRQPSPLRESGVGYSKLNMYRFGRIGTIVTRE
jgi:hypothetical protein